MKRLVLSLAVGGLVALAACGGGNSDKGSASGASTTSTSAETTTNATVSAVDIKGFAYAPPTATVKVGSSLTWTNDDTAPHTVTADDKSFDSGNVAQNDKFSYTFKAAGTFKYHCLYHGNMHGTVTVTS
jgi:plastocyanin